MKIMLIINPCSGRIRVKGELFDILQEFCKAGHTVTTHMTTKRGNATEVAQKACDDHDMIVCCGGDGTLNEVISGMMKADKPLPLGYIPAGSTNDFARTMGLETDLVKAAKAIINSKEEHFIDIGSFGRDKNFVYIASFGLFTAVSYNTQQSAKNALGHIAYVFEALANMTNVETFEIKAKANGKEYEGEYIYGGVSNSTSVGGIFKYDPDIVSLNDGLFEVLLVKKPKNANDLMKIVTGVSTGDLSDTTVFDFFKASKIEFDMPKDVVWSLDGESAKGKMNIVIENLPKQIKFIK